MLSYRSRSHSGWSAALSTLMFSTGLMLVSSTVLRSPPPSPSRQPTEKTDLIHWHSHSVLLFCSSFFFFFFFSHPPTTSSLLFFFFGGGGYLLDYILKTPFWGGVWGGVDTLNKAIPASCLHTGTVQTSWLGQYFVSYAIVLWLHAVEMDRPLFGCALLVVCAYVVRRLVLWCRGHKAIAVGTQCLCVVCCLYSCLLTSAKFHLLMKTCWKLRMWECRPYSMSFCVCVCLFLVCFWSFFFLFSLIYHR